VFVFRYTSASGKRDLLTIGTYDPKGVDGLTLEEGRRKAGEWVRLYQSGVRNLREHFEDAAAAVVTAKAEKTQATEAATRKAKRGSLSKLIDAYVATLAGRQAEYDAGNLMRLHVQEAFPDLAAKQAATVKAEELRDVLARLIDADKGRTAAKLRSYLRAAYGLAMRAGLDPTVPEALTAFAVESNPLDRLPSLAQFNKALHRALSLPELVAFWKHVQAAPPGQPRDALMACVLLGGQRPTQLLRLTSQDVDLSGGTLTILDIKGRNRHANPRRHVLPIPDELRAIIERRKASCEAPDESIFGLTRKETVNALVTVIGAAMAAAKELERGPFSLRDLRRTAETHLAAMGVSSDTRAQLQSHGLGGIQARHYDKHDYMAEKRAALTLWAARLTAAPEPAAVVVPIKRRTRVAA
jgi:integrase